MSYIDFTVPANGILFDLTPIGGATKKIFRPSIFNTIVKVTLTNTMMSYQVSDGTDYNFSFDGIGATQLKINGAVCSSNDDLFNQFIALL